MAIATAVQGIEATRTYCDELLPRLTFLTLCESKIVAYLFRNPKRYISSEELLHTALGSKARQKTTIVERHVCSIRKKIAEIEAKTTIRTIRYHGYVIG